ncbi:hypothetical protein HYC85_023638 [Camellia sinensis]|uniref:Uncharacterized protein n=1 Tax=Camellia sinensis TaxID=4442 RepID=A0A7J7GF51_CAMSI|nr:hypothetical protein HYC85_023638 [Camellia sinensis]
MHIYTYMYIYIYMQKNRSKPSFKGFELGEREKEREREICRVFVVVISLWKEGRKCNGQSLVEMGTRHGKRGGIKTDKNG